jgi:hypothetical protein
MRKSRIGVPDVRRVLDEVVAAGGETDRMIKVEQVALRLVADFFQPQAVFSGGLIMDYRPQGLNGETVFLAEHVPVGKVSGARYGYKRDLLVTVSVRLERLTRQAEYETTDHRTVSRPLGFSITLSVWRPSGGDIVASGRDRSLLSQLSSYSQGFNAPLVQKLGELLPSHLNTMKAACDHQAEDAGLDSPQCPDTDYRWGSAWLVRELSEHFPARVERVFGQVKSDKIWREES